ncbi:4397_t:CDS:2 [Funneliformis mosseae]|uniref:4397_t:CDS:1 n=1 Tax=Funneliformis mosseae TaxID=27381 RepID=A0A9N8WIE9_FUNMO|nr:4397_t:CDS:2 [Funneliformis mosseae]
MASEEIKAEENVEDPMTIEETEEEKPEVKHNEPKLARVEYDYEALESDKLSLDRGAVVTVLEQGDDGWWKGDLNGKIGIFPSNVKPSKSAEDGDDTENQDGKKKKTLNKYGVKPGGLGSLFSGGITIGLKKRNQPSPENSSGSEEKHAFAAPVLRKASVPSHPPLPHLPPKRMPSKPKKVEPKAEVMYDYDADGDDEISLIKSEHVTILEKIDEDGWWKGRNEQGQIGIFPSTYVKEINPAEVQNKSQKVSEEVIESNVEVAKHHESFETQATAPQEEASTQVEASALDEPTLVSADSSILPNVQETCDIYGKDSPTLPASPTLQRRSTTETSSPSNSRRSTYDTSQADAPRRRSINDPSSPTSPRRNSNYDGNEHTTSKRPPSVVSPDLPPIQSIYTNSNSVANIDIPPTSPEEHSTPTRQSDSPKSTPPLTKQPSITKPFSPAKPPVIPPIKRSSSSASKSDKAKKETSPTEPISPKVDRRVSYDSTTALSDEPENNIVEDEQQIDEDVEIPEDNVVEEKIDNKKIVISEEEVVKDDEDSITEIVETIETKKDDDGIDHEIETEEKKPPPQHPLPPLPSGPKLSNLGKDRPTIRNRKAPSVNSAKENASQSQNAILLEAVASAKDEEEQKPQQAVSPPTPPKPVKPEKPAKPSGFKLPPTLGNIQLRPVAKKQPIETPTESMKATTTSTDSNIDTKPISGGVKGISSRFNQFGGIPSSSDVEFRLKKWFNEEINKVKSHFEVQLAEERNKRETLEEQLKELIASLQE